MQAIIALILSLIFAFLAALHLYWVAGGQWAVKATIPTKAQDGPVFVPSTMAIWLVVGGLCFFSLLCWQKTSYTNIHLPAFVETFGLYTAAAVFLLRSLGDFQYFGIFKKIKNTVFAKKDSQIYTPLCVFLSLTTIYIA
jgi:glucan phosphoethanolaminetransferase (alkaline phosphatase superfamily)